MNKCPKWVRNRCHGLKLCQNEGFGNGQEMISWEAAFPTEELKQFGDRALGMGHAGQTICIAELLFALIKTLSNEAFEGGQDD